MHQSQNIGTHSTFTSEGPPALSHKKHVKNTSKTTSQYVLTADDELIDSLPTRVVMAFRSSIYRSGFVASNAHMFLDNNWIDVDQLKEFLERAASDLHPIAPRVTYDTLNLNLTLQSHVLPHWRAKQQSVPPASELRLSTSASHPWVNTG
ncbi:hypothetical protein B0H10DRAFT_1962867 [Mycena sp. CBHHK59/15]|nr:hypothetical protein B0H10DRAFT_1962867 [Mycena sp. CBHHK59/15]